MICPFQDLNDPEEEWCKDPENCNIYNELMEEKEKRKTRHSWAITEERRAALGVAIEYIETVEHGLWREIRVLRAMLEEEGK